MEQLDSNLPGPLNLPEFNVQTRRFGQRTQILDVFRNKYVFLTPEEWVRQHVLHYLVNDHKYPKNLVAVEVSLTLNGLSKRADIVVYDRNMNPWMIVECKSQEIALDQKVYDQAARYNLTLKVPYLVVTNGLKLFAAKINFIENAVTRLKEIPAYG